MTAVLFSFRRWLSSSFFNGLLRGTTEGSQLRNTMEGVFQRTVRRIAPVLTALTVVACATPAPITDVAVAKPNNGPKIEHWQTASGTRVLFVAAPQLPMIDVQVVFDAGSARDNGKGGLAVLTNSLLSEGAGGLDATEIAKRFEELGARLSSDTQRDTASLKLRSLTDPALLTPALAMFTQLLQTPTFPLDSFTRLQTQMLVGLKAEQESPDALSDKALYRGVFGTHPYAQSEHGEENTVKQLTRENVVAFFKRYYVAQNAVIALVGAIDRATAERIAEQMTSSMQTGTPAPALPAVEALNAPRTVTIAHPSQQTHVLLGQPGMRRNDPDFFPLYVGNHIMGGSGLVSRLSDEIREKRGLSYSTFSYFAPMRVNGPFVLGLQTRSDQAETARRLMAQVLTDFIDKGASPKELEAAKLNITGGFPLRVASNGKIADYLAMMGFYNMPLDYLETFTTQVNAVTIEQIRDAFKRRVTPDKMITVIVGGPAAQPNRDERS